MCLILFYQFRPQEMCNSIVSEDCFLIVYCPDSYRTQKVIKMLTALKLIPDCFVTSKMIEKLFTALHVDKNILFFNEDSIKVVKWVFLI